MRFLLRGDGPALRALGEAGQGMVEYALLCALLALAVVGILLMVNPGVQSTYRTVVNGLVSITTAPPSGNSGGSTTTIPQGGVPGNGHAHCPPLSQGVPCR